MSIIPSTSGRLVVSNPAFMSLRSVRGRRTVRRTLQHRGSTRPGGTQTKVTEMLLVVSTVFIALNLPSYIIRLWIFVNEVSGALRLEASNGIRCQ